MRLLAQIQREENCDEATALAIHARERVNPKPEGWRIELTGPGNNRLTIEAPSRAECIAALSEIYKPAPVFT